MGRYYPSDLWTPQTEYRTNDFVIAKGQLTSLSLTPLDQSAFFTPLMLPPRRYNLLRFAVVTTPGSVGSLLRAGLAMPISPTYWLPGNLITDLGTVSGESVGVKDYPCDFLWPGGPCFGVIVGQGAPVTGPTIRVIQDSEDFRQPMALGASDIANRFVFQAGIAGAFPSVFSGFGLTSVAGLCGLRVA